MKRRTVNIRLNEATYKKIKIIAVRTSSSLNEVIEALLPAKK